MHNRPLRILLLADEKPGHYHQSEGVVAALARLRPVATTRLDLRRRLLVPTRTLQQLVNRGASPRIVLRLGYGIAPGDLAPADIVVSAGGETLAANAAAARLLGAANIFCGSLRRLAPEHIGIVIVSLEREARLRPNALLALPPSPFEVRPPPGRTLPGADAVPQRGGLLVGGNSGSAAYTADEWRRLLDFLALSQQRHGMRWLVTTSRRSPPEVGDALAALAARPDSPIERFLDYRTAGPGTMETILAAAQAILVTADSTAMITQAVSACLPTAAVVGAAKPMEPREQEYRDFLAARDWYRSLPFAELAPEAFLKAVREVRPRTTMALDDLAAALARRLPELLGSRTP